MRSIKQIKSKGFDFKYLFVIIEQLNKIFLSKKICFKKMEKIKDNSYIQKKVLELNIEQRWNHNII